MAKRTLIKLVAAAGVASLALVGCSSGDDSSDPAASPTTSAGAEATTVSTDCDPPLAEAGDTPSTDPLKIGTLLPETGSLAFLGPPEFAAVELAVREVNEAGGVLGQPITSVKGDSGDTSTDTANVTTDRLLSEGVQAIVGAASSGVSLNVIDKIANAGVVQFSPANTSDQFVCYQDRGMYFRTAPTDVLQAQALVDIMAGDGVQRVSILALNDPYGTGLANNTQRFLEEAGIPSDQIQLIIYDPQAQSFNAELDDVQRFDPDGIAVIGFDESKRILTRMTELGIGPSEKFVYGTDGNMGNALGEGLATGLLAGMKGTAPMTELSDDFRERVLAVDSTLVDLNYSAEAYDAVVIIALAAEAAKSTAGVDIAANINDVTRGGEQCSSFAECLPLAQAGTDFDYEGVTGPLEFVDAGEPSIGSYAVLEFGEDNTLATPTEFVVVDSK